MSYVPHILEPMKKLNSNETDMLPVSLYLDNKTIRFPSSYFAFENMFCYFLSFQELKTISLMLSKL